MSDTALIDLFYRLCLAMPRVNQNGVVPITEPGTPLLCDICHAEYNRCNLDKSHPFMLD